MIALLALVCTLAALSLLWPRSRPEGLQPRDAIQRFKGANMVVSNFTSSFSSRLSSRYGLRSDNGSDLVGVSATQANGSEEASTGSSYSDPFPLESVHACPLVYERIK